MIKILKRLNIPEKISIRNKNRSIKKAHLNHRKEHPNDYIDIDSIVKIFRSGGGLKHEFQSYKLWELKKYLEIYKPSNVLEFGSGSSTLIFAKYTLSNNCGLTSCDESEHWIENTKKLLGDNLHSNISIMHAERKFGFDNEITTVNYDMTLQDSFDFVLVDGPSQRINNIRRKDSVNADVLNLPKLPKVILVDGRESTFQYLSKKLENTHDAFPSDINTKKSFKTEYNYFSRLVLR
tara:strand:- start:404 stop:1111 length:708 start_codon:yes stop_codon:yes gene_type:complete